MENGDKKKKGKRKKEKEKKGAVYNTVAQGRN